MPLIWTAKSNVMIMKDDGSCTFFQLLHVHLVWLGCRSGKISREDGAAIGRKSYLLEQQKIVTLRLELQKNLLRIYSGNFGALQTIDFRIPYRGLIANYLVLKSADSGTPSAEMNEMVCRGCEILVNAIERKAPGLTAELIINGLPDGFAFENCSLDIANTIPGQFLRNMPSADIDEIIAWMKTGEFKASMSRLKEEIFDRTDLKEDRN